MTVVKCLSIWVTNVSLADYQLYLSNCQLNLPVCLFLLLGVSVSLLNLFLSIYFICPIVCLFFYPVHKQNSRSRSSITLFCPFWYCSVICVNTIVGADHQRRWPRLLQSPLHPPRKTTSTSSPISNPTNPTPKTPPVSHSHLICDLWHAYFANFLIESESSFPASNRSHST